MPKSTKRRKLFATSTLKLTAAFLLSSFYLTADIVKGDVAKKDIKSDVKPIQNNNKIDAERMRLAEIIYKRIIEKQLKEKKTKQAEKFIPYEEKLDSDATFEMLPVPAGKFTWKGKNDSDVLEVAVSPFWMGKTEVSWDEYEPFTENVEKIPRLKNGDVEKWAKSMIENDVDFIARPTGPYGSISHGMPLEGYPAISMTQHAANIYCQWISYQTGHFYRLPTEAEWEYAARAGEDSIAPWGNDPKSAEQYAWYGGDAASHYKKCGIKKPNAWGFVDMYGNVLEWTLDQYVPDRRAYFGKDNLLDPWVKATKPYPHVTKGGHWKSSLEDLIPAKRVPSEARWKAIDPQEPKSLWYLTDVQNIGFRVVRPKKIPTAEEMYHYWNSGVESDGKFALYYSDVRAESKIHDRK